MYKIGDIVEGRYKVKKGDYKTRQYVLVNIYNKQLVTVCYERMLDIFNGRTTLSRIIHNKVQIKQGNFYHKRKFTFRKE